MMAGEVEAGKTANTSAKLPGSGALGTPLGQKQGVGMLPSETAA